MLSVIAHVNLSDDLDTITHTVSSPSGSGIFGGASLAGESGRYDTGAMRLECSVIEIKRWLSPFDCDIDKVDLCPTHVSHPHGVHA